MKCAARPHAGRARQVPRDERRRIVEDRLEPSAAISATPSSKSSRANGLAGETTASIAWVERDAACASSGEARHLLGNRAMFVAAERSAAGGRRQAPPAQEPFFRAPLALERVLDLGEGQAIVFDGVDERLERRRLTCPWSCRAQIRTPSQPGLERERRPRPAAYLRPPPSSRDRRQRSRLRT